MHLTSEQVEEGFLISESADFTLRKEKREGAREGGREQRRMLFN